METYISSKKLRQVTIRLQKEHSSFFYFTMEANDNIAFYSTLPGERNSSVRDILITLTPELSKTMDQIFEHFKTRYPLEILKDEIIIDSL